LTKDIRQIIERHVRSSVEDAKAGGKLKSDVDSPVFLEIPREKNHGDIASNISFLIAKDARKSPLEIARIILEHLEEKVRDEPLIARAEVAGAGFINFFLNREAFYPVLFDIIEQGEKYGHSDAGGGEQVLVEFVSANPTGPLHVGHARNAVVGSVLANILRVCGYDVKTEYYINDVGNQVEALGESLRQRYLELSGKPGDSDVEYKGEYLIELARELSERNVETSGTGFFRDYAVRRIREDIEQVLNAFGISFDNWFSEKNLHGSGNIKKAVDSLRQKGYIEDRDGAVWFKSGQFGDEKDRVIIKSDGSLTYLAADIAYHYDKLSRGFKRLINVWGADHHGYIPRLRASIEALGFSPDALDIVLIQLVKLRREGKPVSMSTRAGDFVTLREVIDEVGKDSVRFFLLMRRSDAQLDFDLELAKKQSMENPVYYVQYAHARICNLLSFAVEKGLELKDTGEVKCELLEEDEEIALIKALSFFPSVVEGSARSLEPHRLTGYLQRVASCFHNFYDRVRVVGEEEEKARSRLMLARAAQITLQNGLRLLGVSAPEKM
jgi:arginyl-tRNA synthetase